MEEGVGVGKEGLGERAEMIEGMGSKKDPVAVMFEISRCQGHLGDCISQKACQKKNQSKIHVCNSAGMKN